MKLVLPQAPSIDAEIDLNLADDGYSLAARLNVALPGLPRDMAETIVEAAHRTCPYSKALAGNIDIAINLV